MGARGGVFFGRWWWWMRWIGWVGEDWSFLFRWVIHHRDDNSYPRKEVVVEVVLILIWVSGLGGFFFWDCGAVLELELGLELELAV